MMTTAIVPASPTPPLALRSDLHEQARDFVAASKAESTKRAYSADWRDFAGWCEAGGVPSLPASPATLALYLTDRAATLKVSTLTRRLAAISQAHEVAHHANPAHSPEVRAIMRGIRRAKGVAPAQKAPALTADIVAMVATLPPTLLGQRDRALLLLGFAGAFRRSELVALDVGDVVAGREGLVVTIRKSKTDQEGKGRTLGIPYGSNPDTCPVRTYAAWLAASGIEAGAIFRPIDRHGRMAPNRLTGHAVARIVKRAANAAGLDASQYAGHSLRAGLATSAAAAGVSERAIMAQTGHQSVVVARRYIRDGSLWRENAAAKVGL